jgi:hypothetical protein
VSLAKSVPARANAGSQQVLYAINAKAMAGTLTVYRERSTAITKQSDAEVVREQESL